MSQYHIKVEFIDRPSVISEPMTREEIDKIYPHLGSDTANNLRLQILGTENYVVIPMALLNKSLIYFLQAD